ncbi:hypothetical protein ACFP1Z_14395 [Streptomyces gamaensis]|uniref:ATP synthase I n=1 Tax=Streptomyces gamaensis TaxID=1763542 RepID=A0ABW0Z2T7_9ACTN
MQSNDARTLLQCAVPTALAGVVAAVVSGVLAGGKGALGSAVGTLVAGGVMALGLYVLQRTARSFPHLFQAMGLVLYVVQFLISAVVLALFRDTTAFNTRAFAFSLLAAVIVWTAAQTRAHLKAKILYVDPESGDAKKSAPAGSAT